MVLVFNAVSLLILCLAYKYKLLMRPRRAMLGVADYIIEMGNHLFQPRLAGEHAALGS
jgi:hypothetical protein